MADNQTTVALNIGSQRISIAVFETAKNGNLVLKAYDSESIVADPALEASRNSQTKAAIADLAQRLKLGKGKARYAISGQSVFTRFVKLPPLQDDNIEQLVTFEAQQHVPFPIDEVVWDYELIEGSSEKEVVIVAIKSDSLDDINEAVNASGLATSEVDVAPMAIYNAFLASYGAPEEPVLLIDIGAKTSNLLYIEGRRFFTRSIPIGGAAITSAISKEYQVSFNEAENQKISNGLVALGGGHTEQLDEAVAALAMVVRNALTRLPSEIARTTNYYRSQHGGSAPRRVILAGGGANLPYTLEFFQEKLNLPVEFFNPMRNVALGKNIDAGVVQREAHLMGELVGLGLRGVGKSAINIDLVPAVVEKARAADRRKPFLIGAAALILLGVGVWAGLQHVAASKAEDRARTTAEIRDNLAPFQQQLNQLFTKESALSAVATRYTNAESDHAFWFDLLAELRGTLASDAVWLSDIEPLNDYNPLPADPKVGAGRGVVKAEFPTTTYGTSALNELAPDPATAAPAGRAPAGRRNQAAQAAPAGPPTANALRIRGYWRENPRNQNLVSELLKKLRDNPGSFRFTAKNDKGEEVPLRDEQILKITVAGEPGDLAFPFEIILPLAREVAVK